MSDGTREEEAECLRLPRNWHAIVCSTVLHVVGIVRIPVRFHGRNGRQMVLTHGGTNGEAAPERESNGSLVAALARAYRWQEQLESGEFASLEDLAAANGVDRTYVGRILRLASLAPEIVEAILTGSEPDGISLRRLQKDLPPQWSAQLRMKNSS